MVLFLVGLRYFEIYCTQQPLQHWNSILLLLTEPPRFHVLYKMKWKKSKLWKGQSTSYPKCYGIVSADYWKVKNHVDLFGC